MGDRWSATQERAKRSTTSRNRRLFIPIAQDHTLRNMTKTALQMQQDRYSGESLDFSGLSVDDSEGNSAMR